ncbi:hypothetical protein BJ508DRAFT_419399 [Ascobolus immersus RN42]|uniref:Ty3 transposon capsid-like protein domain-containing protein n=1 Tax=Ascobolus immersus RN42 TaxID=1160509 RepID=A0A3N4HGG6_ASCIM|nr:hypothetical protein BJ508DRAFT_419399 [Ascobolus immersus RN42]
MANDASNKSEKTYLAPLGGAAEKSSTKPLFEQKHEEKKKTEEAEDRRRSLLYYNQSTKKDEEWHLTSVQLDSEFLSTITVIGAHEGLVECITSSNELLDVQMETWIQQQGEHIGTALDVKFEELRHRITKADEEYRATFEDSITSRKTILDLEHQISQLKKDAEQSEMERGELYRRLRAAQSTTPGGTTISIEVPKGIKTQLQRDGLDIFEGSGDVEVVYKFIKGLEYHIDLLEDEFTNIQRIAYATSYMAGGARSWAKEWRRAAVNTALTFDIFLAAFKTRWVPENAHVHLVQKLEKMELRINKVDKFNEEFTNVLRLLEKHSCSDLRESDQYYKIYHRKIKDQNLLFAIQTLSLQTPGGLTLEKLMEYVSKLAMTKQTRPPATPNQQH